MRFSVPGQHGDPLACPVLSSRTELRAARNSFWDSSSGRSWATAIIIPNTVETSASAEQAGERQPEPQLVELRAIAGASSPGTAEWTRVWRAIPRRLEPPPAGRLRWSSAI